MAMINCPECGKEISDQATTCPNCGKPIVKKQGFSYATTQQELKKVCKHCKTTIPKSSKICPNCGGKQGGIIKWIVIAIIAIGIIGAAASGRNGDKAKEENNTQSTQESSNNNGNSSESKPEEKENPEEKEEETKSKYNVGDTWENKTLRMTYITCYEFTDYNQYNAPANGKKIVCAEFEFENIGNSDTTVMYTDFHGYADGYEVSQSYAPDGTGLEFSVKMSAGRKGTGKVAFEVPENSQEIEIEFSPSFWTSENIIFVYE